jgi:Rhs element Vgr protein
MDTKYELQSVDVVKSVNKIPTARMTVFDGSVAAQKFEGSEDAFFEPGKEIEIKARYEGDDAGDQTLFKGIILRHGIRASSDDTRLTVEMKDASFKLTTKKKSNVYKDQTDSDIINKVISDGGGKAGSIAATKGTHPMMVQYRSTDWDFIVSRADANGHLVVVDDGEISTIEATAGGAASLTIEYGVSDVFNMEMEVDIRHQHQSVESFAWDANNFDLTAPKAGAELSLAQGNLEPSAMAGALEADSFDLVSGISTLPDEMTAWADARMVKDRLSMLRGYVEVYGTGAVKPGDLMSISGVSERFNGDTLVTGVRHQLDRDGWYTAVQFGISAEDFSKQADIVERPAAGLVPAVNGLQLAVVEPFEEDPDGQHRVKVKLPAMNSDENLLWARLTSMDSGPERGVMFRPEAGDEVVLGFLNDDPRQPIILGSVHGSVNAPPFPVTDVNEKKGFVSREQIKLEFDDDAMTVLIETPGGNKLFMEDETGITIECKNGNKLVMDDAGVTIESAKDVTVDGKNITITGTKIDVN